jgi:hypothetical protein
VPWKSSSPRLPAKIALVITPRVARAFHAKKGEKQDAQQCYGRYVEYGRAFKKQLKQANK